MNTAGSRIEALPAATYPALVMLGAWLASLRAARGLSGEQAATRAGLRHQDVAALESGTSALEAAQFPAYLTAIETSDEDRHRALHLRRHATVIGTRFVREENQDRLSYDRYPGVRDDLHGWAARRLALERRADGIFAFATAGCLPPLLQTPAYARSLDWVLPDHEATAVRARAQLLADRPALAARTSAVIDPGLLMCGDPKLVADQLDHLLELRHQGLHLRLVDAPPGMCVSWTLYAVEGRTVVAVDEAASLHYPDPDPQSVPGYGLVEETGQLLPINELPDSQVVRLLQACAADLRRQGATDVYRQRLSTAPATDPEGER